MLLHHIKGKVFVGFKVLTMMIMKSMIFFVTVCSLVEVHQQCACHLLVLVSCVAFSSVLEMEAISFGKRLVDFYHATSHYNPEDCTLEKMFVYG
jgi:hypothetical protein